MRQHEIGGRSGRNGGDRSEFCENEFSQNLEKYRDRISNEIQDTFDDDGYPQLRPVKQGARRVIRFVDEDVAEGIEKERIERHRDRLNHAERRNGGFQCTNDECKAWVSIHDEMGTKNRNHCPCCLFSKHVDEKSGDRKSDCRSKMEPIALTWKIERTSDTEGICRPVSTTGDLMLVHCCRGCGFLRINRIAADDLGPAVIEVLLNSYHMDLKTRSRLEEERIVPLKKCEEDEVRAQFEN